MAEVVRGSAKEPGALGPQPAAMNRLVEPHDARGAPAGLALVALSCVIAFAASHALGTADAAAIGWIDIGFGVGVLLATAVFGSIRRVNHLTDRLEATELVDAGVQVDDAEPPPSRLRRLAREAGAGVLWTGVLVGGIAVVGFLMDGDGNHWAFIFFGLFLGAEVKRQVTKWITAKHEAEQGVYIYQPEDEDEWYEQATGNELEDNDPGPLFHMRRRA